MNTELLQKLVKNLIDADDEIEAVVVADREGLPIVSQSKNLEMDDEMGATVAMFDSFLERVKKDFGSAEDFLNISTIDDQKFVFADAGPNAILTVLSSLEADETRLKVFTEHIADKIESVLDGVEVNPEIPQIIEVLSKMRGGKIPTGEYSQKLIILGDPMVGKTSLIKRFVDNTFKENYISSIGVDISKKEIKLSDNCAIYFTIWDIAGQIQTMAPYRKRFYSGAEHAFLQFDITKRSSFENLEMWLDDLKKNIQTRITITIVANKIDRKEEWEVTPEEIAKKAEEIDCPYILTSAKTGANVIDAFRYAAFKFCENL